MALESYPNWMPNPLQNDFTLSSVENRTISNMENGTTLRREFDSDEMEASCTIQLTPLEASWFERFVQKQLSGGSQWFKFPLWIGGQIQRQPVRFKTLPRISNVNALYSKYNFTLQVEKRSFMADDVYEFLAIISPDDLLKLSSQFGRLFDYNLRGVTQRLPELIKLKNKKAYEEDFNGVVSDLSGTTLVTDQTGADSASLRTALAGCTDIGFTAEEVQDSVHDLAGTTRTHYVLFKPWETIHDIPLAEKIYPANFTRS